MGFYVKISDCDLDELQVSGVEEMWNAGVNAVVEQLHSLEEEQDAIENG